MEVHGKYDNGDERKNIDVTPEDGASSGSVGGSSGIGGRDSGDTVAGAADSGKPKRKQKGKILELAVLNEEKEEKPERKKRKIKSESSELLIKSLLSAFSGVAGNRNSIWILSEQEINSIAEPAGRILNRYVGEKVEEFADGLSLAIAIIFVFGTRIIIINNQKKEVVNPERKEEALHSIDRKDKQRDAGYGAAVDTVAAPTIY